ncbi:hypothetical protein XcfCFBP6991P_23500 (plasmid) [Xanthomonas citri pv. phaseoli var. fuscans]|uniref:DNA helicase DnaB-like N-terminal domain-containing protein n=2 Tax=Xanthomonas TaxID=338 RepID=A0A7Z7NGE2_XANCH|nr:hypothetical protein XcfCFBP6991P_23500 [Xanthomonas citri pv. phaseoli var. fuscans]SOO23817.1 hypothetical protein XFF6991_30137 [Xanthomonas phaseoli pv. phaseoli]
MNVASRQRAGRRASRSRAHDAPSHVEQTRVPDALDRIADRLVEDDFYRRDHRLIYRAIREMAENSILSRVGASENPGAVQPRSFVNHLAEANKRQVQMPLIHRINAKEGRINAKSLSANKHQVPAFNAGCKSMAIGRQVELFK